VSKRRRAAIFGAGGQIGREMVRVLSAAGIDAAGFTRAQCDVTEPRAIDTALAGFATGDLVVNAAAYNDVAGAEAHFADALRANGCAPYLLALAADRCGATVVHFGSDYVFDGSKRPAYVESDAPHPLNAYGRTKLCGEILVAAAAPRHYIARVSSVFGTGSRAGRANFVERVIAAGRDGSPLELMADGAISPTYALDAAELVARLLVGGAPYGTYHVANSGTCTWFEFGHEIATMAGSSPLLIRLDAGGSDKRVRRPLCSALESERLPALGIFSHPWQDGLRRYLESAGRLAAE
jgi:dTDP-4-dehydrorhamnose reductase